MDSLVSAQRLPDFLVIGGMRCGSTTLAGLLGSHHALFLPSSKELHYFDHRNPDIKSLREYTAVFAPAERHQLVGEVTPDYLSTPGCDERIFKALPEAKLVLILRDPVMRAWSHYRYSVYLGNEVEPFDRALIMEDERLAHPIPEHDVVFSYRQRGRYIDHIERFMGYYPRSNLHILFLEELLEDPSRVVDDLFAFLGVTSPRSWRGHLAITNQSPLKSIRVAGESGDDRRRFWQRRLLQRVISTLQYCFSAKWRERIARTVEHSVLNSDRLDPTVARELREYFRPFDQRLARFIARPLPWG